MNLDKVVECQCHDTQNVCRDCCQCVEIALEAAFKEIHYKDESLKELNKQINDLKNKHSIELARLCDENANIRDANKKISDMLGLQNLNWYALQMCNLEEFKKSRNKLLARIDRLRRYLHDISVRNLYGAANQAAKLALDEDDKLENG